VGQRPVYVRMMRALNKQDPHFESENTATHRDPKRVCGAS